MSRSKSKRSRTEVVSKTDTKEQRLAKGISLLGSPRVAGLSALLALLTLAAFSSVFQCAFVGWDDPGYVTANRHVQVGLTFPAIRWALSATDKANWHPLTWFSHMLDCQIFGLRPWGHHLTNLLLHTINTVLLFRLLNRMTGARWRSFVVAALFGLHPLRVESVAWISERKDVLSMLFFLLTLWAYTRYAHSSDSPRARPDSAPAPLTTQMLPPLSIHYVLAIVFFCAGLMAKPMLVTVPIVLLLIDFWPLARFGRCSGMVLVTEKIPFCILAAASSAVTLLVQERGGAVVSLARLPFLDRAQNALVSYGRYAAKTVLPVKLAAFYPLPDHWPVAVVALAAVFLVGATILAWVYRRRFPYLPMGWAWFVLTLVPVIGLIRMGALSMADRYSYIPSIGGFILMVWAARDLASRWRLDRRLILVLRQNN
jgi:hypothetical protein